MASLLGPFRNLPVPRALSKPAPFEDERDLAASAQGAALGFRALLPPAAMTSVLLNYAYLQLLDLLTTAAFLLAGVKEANPVVVLAMNLAANPILGVAAVKALAFMLGLYCWWSNRGRLLKMATAFYAVLVAYNLVCLILGLGAR
jgi:hypothetical protein